MKTKNLILLAVALCTAALFPARAHAADVVLQWDDNSDNETGFKIERAPAAPSTAFVAIGSVGANVKTFTDTGLAAKTGYQYRVQAFNADTVSAYSNIASTVTPPAPILAPGNLRTSAPTTVSTLTIPAGQTVVVVSGKN